MTHIRDELAGDLQASVPEIQLGLARVGVTNVSKAIRIRHAGREQTFAADISCTVDLDPAQKGVHMSRFPEIFGEAIDAVVIAEAFHVETLAEHIARHIIERQGALRAEVRIEAQYPVARRTPVTDLPTQAMVKLIGIAAASPARVRRVVGVEATGSTRARALRGSFVAPRRSGCSRPASRTATLHVFSNWYRSRPTTNAGAGGSSSAQRRM
jgi:GTP cyclohydrolase-4